MIDLSRRASLLTFSGVDCSGKTTQIELLSQALNQTNPGRSCVTLWHRPGYSPWLDRARTLVRRLRPGFIPSPDTEDQRAAERRDQIFRSPVVSRAWVSMALLDSIFQYALLVRRHLLAGHHVICDRWVEDGLLDLALRFPDHHTAIGHGAGLVRALAPSPAAAFLLMLDADTVAQRAKRKREPFPDPDRIRAKRYQHYSSMAEGAPGNGLRVVNAAGTVEEVHKEICAVLGIPPKHT